MLKSSLPPATRSPSGDTATELKPFDCGFLVDTQMGVPSEVHSRTVRSRLPARSPSGCDQILETCQTTFNTSSWVAQATSCIAPSRSGFRFCILTCLLQFYHHSVPMTRTGHRPSARQWGIRPMFRHPQSKDSRWCRRVLAEWPWDATF